MTKRLWLTYAWRDNESESVDYLIQELSKRGLDVRYDRAVLLAGRPLWDQLDQQIDWENIDAWAIYVTRQSLESEPCREELSYALNIALRQGRMNFPLIGIFPEHVDPALIPKAISSRLYVPLSAPTALQDILDAVDGKKTQSTTALASIGICWHQTGFGSGLALEFWPRLGSFSRTFVAYSGLPQSYRPSPALAPRIGTRGSPSLTSAMCSNVRIGSKDNYAIISAGDHVAHGQSASVLLPMGLGPEARMIVGGIDASGLEQAVEVPLPPN